MFFLVKSNLDVWQQTCGLSMMLHSETNKDFQPYTTDLDGTYKLFQFPSPGHEQS